jgi:hypothetical protein
MIYVLAGADDSAAGASRSDAPMVLHLASDRRSAYLISFPRDLWVPIPGFGRNKINGLAFGGAELTVLLWRDLTEKPRELEQGEGAPHCRGCELDGFNPMLAGQPED